MDNLEAVKMLRTWMRPSSGILTQVEEGILHTCKKVSTLERFIEAVALLGGEILCQTQDIFGEVSTIASLPAASMALITPGLWGGSKPGRIYKGRAKADYKLDVRLNNKHIQLLEALALKWYGPRANSKTIRRLIEEAAEKEGVTIN